MADTKITNLTELAATPADGDMLTVVDVSDTTMAATGTNKKIKASRFVTTNGTAQVVDSLRFGQGGARGSLDGQASAGWVGVGANFYYSGNDPKYRTTNYASQIFFDSGLTFNVAASGTTDNTISWTTSMSISNGGILTVYDRATFRGSSSSTPGIWFADSAGNQRSFFGLIDDDATPVMGLWNTGDWRLTIDWTGYVGIGTESPSYKLDVNGAAHASSFPTSSDERFKNISGKVEEALSKITQLNGYYFTWKPEYSASSEFLDEDGRPQMQIGLLAQEVAQVLPELTTKWKHKDKVGKITKDAYSVDYSRLIAVLIEALKQLKEEVDDVRRDVGKIRQTD